ncbi:BA3454 family stress response protein [Peribacillus kribbensis]|nr:BA3454 family stress response protein [Peribacillus kribbensis]
MYEVFVSVSINGRIYQTNVLAEKGMSDKMIQRIAREQVAKQWQI